MKRVAGLGLMMLGMSGAASLLPAAPAAPAKSMPGAALFEDKGCVQCHGVNGVGTAKGPNLSAVGRRLKRDQIELQIREGGQQMPAFGDVLQPGELTSLVDFLATWKAKDKRAK